MKKNILKFSIGILGIYLICGIIFNLIYDHPPAIHKAAFASYTFQEKPNNYQTDHLDSKIRETPGISGFSVNDKSKLITVIYHSDKTNIGTIENKLKSVFGNILPYEMKAKAGASCPYHAFMDNASVAFNWGFFN